MKQLPVEDLLKNGQWVRHVALSLLRDKTLVDDVVQEVWLKAVERPPDKPQALPLWLKKVARSIAFRANRVLTMRQRAEARSPVAGVSTSPDEIAEQLEIQRLLTGLVLELAPPYQTVVFLHYFGGKKLTEIATELGVPDSTVRTRLSRALEQLKGRLIARHGDRQWRTVLLPLALGAPGSETLRRLAERGSEDSPSAEPAEERVAAPSGGLLRPGLAWVALVPTFVALLWLGLGSGRDAIPRTAPSATGVVAARQTAGFRGPADATEAAPRAEANAAPAAGGGAVDPAAPATPAVAVRGAPIQIVDVTSGAPVADAEVYFIQLTQNEGIPAGRTDGRGMAFVPSELLRRDALVVVAPGYVEHREAATLRDLEASPYLVEIHPYFPASVRVVLPDGTPAIGVPVVIDTPDAGDLEPQETATDGEGLARYVYRHPSSRIRIDLGSYVTVSRRALTPETRVELRTGRRVRGVLLDAGGNTVSRCRVTIETESAPVPLLTETAPDGSFALGCLADERTSVTFHHVDWPSFRQVGTPPASGTWIFRLPRGDHLVGRVEAPGGFSLEGGFAFVLTPASAPDAGEAGVVSKLKTVPTPKKGRATFRLRTLLRSRLDEDGRFDLGPVTTTELDQFLWIYHPRLVNHFERLDPTAYEQGRRIRLRQGETVAGRLVGPTGQPVKGALLHLGEIWSNARGADQLEGIVGRTRTRDDGSFEFVGVPARIEKPLGGAPDETDAALHRTRLFLAAFPPDELLALGDLTIADSPVWQGFSVRPGERDLRVLAAARPNSVVLNVRLRDREGVPVRAWTPAVVLDGEGQPHLGRMGRRGAEERFYAERPLRPELLTDGHLIVLPQGFTWRQVDLGDSPTTLTVEIGLSPSRRDATTVRLVDAGGTPVPTRELLIGVPFGEEAPGAALSLGTTDESGELTTGDLEPGIYTFYTLRRGQSLGRGNVSARSAGGSSEVSGGRWLDLGPSLIEPGVVTLQVAEAEK